MRVRSLGIVAIVFSFVVAGLFSLNLFATPPDCIPYWNFCVFNCSGTPEMVVHSDGTYQVHCTNVQNSNCPQPEYYSGYCY
jgi:hypothetical protein